MTFKTYNIESADFMLNHRTYKGEQIMAIHELNGKIYLFTPNHTYIVKRMRWYHKIWRRLWANQSS